MCGLDHLRMTLPLSESCFFLRFATSWLSSLIIIRSVVSSCVYFQTQHILEMKMRLEELQMENEYQLRLKDMNYNEKLKELSENLVQQIETLKTSQQVCLNYKSPHRFTTL